MMSMNPYNVYHSIDCAAIAKLDLCIIRVAYVASFDTVTVLECCKAEFRHSRILRRYSVVFVKNC